MSQRVLIVGGGLSGLALAQGLKRLSPPIPFRIFERDAAAAHRAQGYRIRISSAALQALLPPSLFAKFVATSIPVTGGGGGGALDARTGETDPTAVMPGPPPGARPPPPGFTVYNVDRTVLRNVLLQGLEDDVCFGKKLESYEVLEDESVQVSFADGSVERGSLLVGADGVRSGVRRQLMPNFPMVDTEGRSVFGKTDLTDELAAQLPEGYLRGMHLAGLPGRDHAEKPLKLLFEVMKFDPAARALGLGVPDDYIYWVLCSRADVVAAEVADTSRLLSLSGTESASLASALIKDWCAPLRAIASHANEESASTLEFFSCTKEGLPRSWEALRRERASTPVTLIGDSAHPMPPVGGVGAESAFQDALGLLQALESLEKGTSPKDAIMSYETSMLKRVDDAVERSTMGAIKFFGMRLPSELQSVSI